MTTPATPAQAREAADLYRATGTPVSATTVYSLVEQVEALTKERDALKSSELGLNRYAAKVNSDNLKLTAERDALKGAARLALDALLPFGDHGLIMVNQAIAALQEAL